MSRNDIIEFLRTSIAEGRLTSKCIAGLSYSEINSRVSKGLFLLTSIRGVLATDAETRDRFESLVASGRIMSTDAVKLRKNLLTQYEIHLHCADGELARFASLGRASILYID